jgi:hypothetical protein
VNAPATFEQPRRFDVKPVELTVHGRIVGTLPITLAGRSGPNGRPGAAGALGAAQKLPLRPGGRGLMV